MSRTIAIAEEKRRPPTIQLPRIPTAICYKRPLEVRNHETNRIIFGDSDNYQILELIGRGRYSLVYNAFDSSRRDSCVVKKLLDEDTNRIKRELRYLSILKRGPNIIRARDVIRLDVVGEKFKYGVVFEKIRNVDFRILYRQFDALEIRYYLYQLLNALSYAHHQGIMHRDVKPENIVIDPDARNLRLIDWGFGALYLPGQAYFCGACTLAYRAPELLLGYRHYDYSMDMWSFACVAAGMMFRRDRFFEGVDERTQMQIIGRFLGRQMLDDYLQKYHIRSEAAQLVGQEDSMLDSQ
ncbi:casein kinase II subunit alpha-2 [Galendromus occidentalis]|uniref:non-specific serine/threonine protein kinase n=1 Tax=Galendromus occidentalis TaxID=34638 RepID=A0AAJ7SHG4_9ACAR|nr:casein kinase II subunit alpha-2 [Galendromus occidentalis]